MFSKKDSWRHRSMSCVQILWNLADWKFVKSCIIYRTKKNSARCPALASAGIAPKICQGQFQTIYSECPKFHPNPFTSGGVIAERVNTVQACHKVYPIPSEAVASSPSNPMLTDWLWPPHVIRQAIIFLPCGFFYLSSILFSSPNLSRRRLDVCHTSTHGVALVRI